MLQDVQTLTDAYHWFNKTLFGDSLPKTAFVYMGRKKGKKGWFWKNSLVSREDGSFASELTLNHDTWSNDRDIDILATLVHEMTHLQEAIAGTAGKNGYHNKVWAQLMLAVGLTPISYDQPGKMTGYKVGHSIDIGGAFEVAAREFLKNNKLLWQTNPTHAQSAVTKTRKRRTKIYKYELSPGMILRSEKRLEAGLVKHMELLIDKYN